MEEKNKKVVSKPKKRNRYRTGEDIDMLREKRESNRKRKPSICDTHIDGA